MLENASLFLINRSSVELGGINVEKLVNRLSNDRLKLTGLVSGSTNWHIMVSRLIPKSY